MAPATPIGPKSRLHVSPIEPNSKVRVALIGTYRAQEPGLYGPYIPQMSPVAPIGPKSRIHMAALALRELL